MSKIMAKITLAPAPVQSWLKSAKRMAVAPLHRPSKVRVEGTSLLMERSSSFSSRAATIWRARERRVPRPQTWARFPLNPNLASMVSPARTKEPGTGQDAAAGRKIDIHPAAEADNAKSRAPLHPLSLDDIANNAPRHQAGDLHHRQIPGSVATLCPEPQRHALIVNAGLVEGGVEEFAGPVGLGRPPCR